MDCPFAPLEREPSEEDAEAKKEPAQNQALAQVGQEELSGKGLSGLGEFLGPILALFLIMRGIQTMEGLPIGTLSKAGFAEEATTRVLEPRIPAKEGPRPSVPGRVPVPAKHPIRSTGVGGMGGGFFVNQAAQLKKLTGRR